ncbi:hypothetical protein [Roseococcus pinisoli]|uniref:Uncharacterized protein n=1 Tax=Roseococcus pinisoli TaxID=2835040 RepID=A0ABS5QFA2_9PROT|nr:hypothetical protein [Roseococcus pinisoli]MBS7812382.1 hypothetical protein [Roseococcus pinisoli]
MKNPVPAMLREAKGVAFSFDSRAAACLLLGLYGVLQLLSWLGSHS